MLLWLHFETMGGFILKQGWFHFETMGGFILKPSPDSPMIRR